MQRKKEVGYKVGYGKPPSTNRFRKGKSGNPSGRAKGPRNVTKLLLQALSEPVTVNENGQRRQITKGEAMLKQLVNKGAAGDARSIQLLLAELRSRLDIDPAEDRGANDTPEQLLMLGRLSVDERIELRRLVAKAQGTANGDRDDSKTAAAPVESHQGIETRSGDSKRAVAATDADRPATISERTDQNE